MTASVNQNACRAHRAKAAASSESVMTMPSTGPAKTRPAAHQRAMATVKVTQARTKALLTMFLMANPFYSPIFCLMAGAYWREAMTDSPLSSTSSSRAFR